MRTLRVLFASFALVLLAPIMISTDAQSKPCQAANVKATKLRNQVIAYLTDTSYAELKVNEGFGTVDTAQVAIVSQDSICTAVTDAANQSAVTPRTVAMHVVKFGNFYAAADPDGDELVAIFLLDSAFAVKTIMVSQ